MISTTVKRQRNPRRASNQRRTEEQKSTSNAPTHRKGGAASRDILYATPLFPAVVRKKLFYYDYDLSIAIAAGVPTNYFFTANGLFDPNVTGTGHQPLGFDQMMLMYNQYTVCSSKASVTMYSAATGIAARAGVYLAPDASSITDPIRLMENGLINTSVHSATSVDGYIKSHNLDCDVVKYFGRGKALDILNDSRLYGTSAANPTEQVFFAVTAWDPFGASNLTMYFDILIEYDAYFWEPRKLTVS